MCNDNPEKYQVQRRIRQIVLPCDRLSETFFQFPAETYRDVIERHGRCTCLEKIVKGKKIFTPYFLELIQDYEDKLPPDAFAREVFYATVSAYEQGFNVITFNTILRSLTGGNQTRVQNDQYVAIRGAFDKLSRILIKIDLAPLLSAFPKYAANFKGDRNHAEIGGILLPMRYLETEINGHRTLAIEILGESPLMTVAKVKKQLLTYDLSPLAISGQNNTPQVITVKNYLLRRIELMKQHKMSSTILFETLYKECSLANATKKQKQDVRKESKTILNSFKAGGVIKHFEFKKQGNLYRSIKITPI